MNPTGNISTRLLQRTIANGEFLLTWCCLILLTWVYLQKALLYFPGPIAPDAALVYLPYARKLLDAGGAFLLTPESVYVPPVSYMWPALFGGEVVAVKTANMISGIFMILLVYGIGKRAHSREAGLVAALMFAISPFLISWIPTPLSEPPFYLFTLIWLWGAGEAMAGNKWAIPVASIGLTLSILTRSIWLYPSIMLLVITVGLPLIRPAAKSQLRPLALLQVLGLMVPVAVIVKNLILFNLPAIDTGTGGALYYGANIITNGFEPPLLGLNYEDGGDSRSLLGNREHASVAMQFFHERTWAEIAGWYVQKASWVLLFTRLEAPMAWSIWRAIELSLAAAAFWWGIKRKSPLVMLLGAGVGVQILQTSIVLYNIRYSIDNVELLLVPLAAVGFVVVAYNSASTPCVRWPITLPGSIGQNRMLQNYSGGRYWLIGAVAFLALLGALQLREIPRLNIPPQIPATTLFEYKAAPDSSAGISPNIGELARRNFDLAVPRQEMPKGLTNAVWLINLKIEQLPDESCRKAMLQFINAELGGGREYFDVIDDGTNHEYYIGAASMNAGLFPSASGKLSLALDCSNTRIHVNRVALIAPRVIERYFGQNAGIGNHQDLGGNN